MAVPQEVAPGVWRLAIPLPNPPGTVNAYAIATGDGVRLVDCGWNTPRAYAALVAQLRALGVAVPDITEILVTHIHPDHFGLAGRLVEESGARELMHRLEAALIRARYDDTRALVEEMEAWLHINGVPRDELVDMAEASLGMLSMVGAREGGPLWGSLLDGGEILEWGGYRFEVLWTPGHARGLVCLYERQAGLLLCSDHVLERTSPHVGLHAQSLGNPLGDYLSSLHLVRDLPVRVALPGHGAPFAGLAARVDAIVEHHERRCQEMLRVLGDSEESAFTVAGRLSWRGAGDGWSRLAPFQRRMAVTETIAHLEYLHGRDCVAKRFAGAVVLYSRSKSEEGGRR
jgi:glyoxylase-like metal-dependent hydrolase (beta-lactamase superfamily II)